ncbi:MAG: tetraacyldisaccharide 4'-kinase [Deltaproteobacteria bacterium]
MNSILPTYWRNLAKGNCYGAIYQLLLALLIPLSLPYTMLQRLRTWLYRAGLLESKRLPRPVVSVGNITVGGTGKTPVITWLASQLIRQEFRVAVLSRGYGGSMEGECVIVSDGREIFRTAEECGDEPYLLATTVPGLMVVIGSDRHQAGMLAMERLLPDVFLLDDGFQHIRLQRDMNILLLDCERPFGNGWTLPAGLLRESRSSVLRADWIIRTRCREVPKHIPGLDIPETDGRHVFRDIVPICGGEPQDITFLQGKRIIAFAGIAEPDCFFDDLRMCGADISSTISLTDHVRYETELVAAILDKLRTSDAVFAVTTEKDAVKLRGLQMPADCQFMAARLDVKIAGGENIIREISNLLQ